MKELLIKIKIVQVVSNEQRYKDGLKRLGKGYFKAYRLNPLNPLSYILVVVTIPVILFMYGFVGSFEKAINPFRWD
jgi:membrane protein insertase Oxa1/YidC/SpoIIIJ